MKFKKGVAPVVLLFLVGIFSFVFVKTIAGYGEPASAPVCTAQTPKKAWLYLTKTAGQGEVELFWDKVDGASSWTVAYGVEAGKYVYGLSNFGDSNSRGIKISYLPNGKYYFVVRANNDCMPGGFSDEWAITVGKGYKKTAAVTEKTPLQKVPPSKQKEPIVTQAPKYEEIVPSPGAEREKIQRKKPITTQPTPPRPTPTPKPGFFQKFFNFIKGMFGG